MIHWVVWAQEWERHSLAWYDVMIDSSVEIMQVLAQLKEKYQLGNDCAVQYIGHPQDAHQLTCWETVRHGLCR